MPGVAKDPLARFWARVEVASDDECWPWTGGRMTKGYGVFFPRKGKAMGAHRFSWELHNGVEIPDRMQVMHSCDNPPCVNPAHLSVGTSGDNNADKSAKGRNPGNPTSRGGVAPKWPPSVVAALRKEGLTFREIGDKLDISPATALRTLRR